MGKTKGPTDFNDLHLERGLQAVKDQLEAAISEFRQSGSFPALAQSECPGERQPFEGEKPLPVVKAAARFGLEVALNRYALITQTAEVWDTEAERRMKKAALRDALGVDVFKDWLADPGRLAVEEKEVVARIKAKAKALRIERGREAWQDSFQLTESGQVKADIANAKLVLEFAPVWEGVLGYCEFSYRIIKRKAPPFMDGEAGEWTDADTARLRIWLSENYSFTPKTADALDVVLVVAQSNRFHPVREYLAGLKWDKKPRVRQWLHSYLGAEDDRYHGLIGTMWLVSAVARVMQPPVKVDSVIIFEGLQGLGKSTTLSILGGEWFTDTPINLGDKDGFQQMQGMWIIELAELDSFNKAESTRAKQFFGSSVDRYRPSYGRMVQTFPRQCVFAGTTNQDQYLKDATGNRRYWPAMCTKVAEDLLQADRDQLWAEAYQLYLLGEKWWPQEHDKHLFERQQEGRFEADVWEEVIEQWLLGHTREQVLMSELMEEALKMQSAQMKPPEQKRVGQIMAHLGWKKCRPRKDGGRVAGYQRPISWIAKKLLENEQEMVDDF